MVGAVACGSDSPTQAATATKGDAFCTASQGEFDAVKALPAAFNGTPESLKAAIGAVIAAGKSAQKVAPKDAQDLLSKAIAAQERMDKGLADFNYDMAAFGSSEAGQALIDDQTLSQQVNDLGDYLREKCGIAGD